MNYRMTARYVSMVLKFQAAFLLVPLIYSLCSGEFSAVRGFLVAAVLALLLGFGLGLVHYDTKRTVYIKDGFIVVAISWIIISLVGAIPFFISGEIPNFLDAFFESTSGFTTTGASILQTVEVMSNGLLLWRSLTHWIGGMGVLVFLLAVVPAISGGERTMSVMKAESPGPAPGKLVPKLRQSSKILYIIYLTLTILQVIFLLAGGMSLFDSMNNAMATAGTGGFAVHSSSIAAYNSPYIETVITVFMVLFGINFNTFYFVLIRNFSGIFRSEELRAYLGIIAVSILLITVNITGTVYDSGLTSLRYSSFSVASIISSTGFSTANFDLWPSFSKAILFILMFIGACAGSTGGGLKVSRILMLMREGRRLLFRMVHPRAVETVKIDSKTVEKSVVHSVNAYFFTFMLIYAISFLLISLDGFDLETNISAVIACFNNIGPGFGMVGPNGNFASFGVLSKLVLSFDMLLGRLELYPLLLLLSPRTWKRL